MFALGAIGSIAAGGYESVSDSFFKLKTESGGHVEKKFLYKKLANISGSIPEMTEQLRSNFQAVKQEQAQKQTQKSLASFRIASEKFDSMCDHYLGEIEASDDVRMGFRNVVQKLQQYGDLLDEYNQAFLLLANLELDIATYDETFRVVEANSGPTGQEELLFVNALLLQAKSDMGAIALKNLYQASRAVNCLSLQATSVFEPLVKLQSFSALTGVLLKDCFTVYLKDKDIENMKRYFEGYPRNSFDESAPVTVIIDDTRYPSIMSEIRSSKKRCTFKFYDRIAFAFGPKAFQPTQWDVRLQKVEVYLPGVVDKSGGTPSVHVGLVRSGKSYFFNQDGKPQEFILPERKSDFYYTYTPKSTESKDDDKVLDGTQGLKATSEAVATDTAMLRLDKTQLLGFPMESPFTTWSISLLDENTDSSSCQKIEFRFHVHWRSRSTK